MEWIPCGNGFIEADVNRWREGIWKRRGPRKGRTLKVGESRRRCRGPERSGRRRMGAAARAQLRRSALEGPLRAEGGRASPWREPAVQPQDDRARQIPFSGGAPKREGNELGEGRIISVTAMFHRKQQLAQVVTASSRRSVGGREGTLSLIPARRFGLRTRKRF